MEGEGRDGVREDRFAFVGALPEFHRRLAGAPPGTWPAVEGVAPVTFSPRVVPPTIGHHNPRVPQ